MNKIKTHIKYIILILLLFCVIIFLLKRDNKYQEVIIENNDTIVLTIRDTIFIENPIYIEKKQVDTLIVYVDSSKTHLQLPIMQKKFEEKGKYTLYISGVEPLNLDAIIFYPSIEYRTIIKTTTKEIYPIRWNYYINGGFLAIKDTFIPKLGINITNGKKFIFGANFGYYDKSLCYGFEVGYKL